MVSRLNQSDIHKESIKNKLYGEGKTPLQKYRSFFVGSESWSQFFHFELFTMLLSPLPGALGLVLRKIFVPGMLGCCGRQSLWGRDIQIRYPGNLRVGNRVAVDDHCMFDARSDGGITIGDDAVIARDCVFRAKTGPISFGDRCTVSCQVQLSSTAGIHIGSDVGIGGQCYIGGGLYHTERTDIPMMQQGNYSRGPVVIGDDVWVGAGVRILDGVTIGRGVFIAAGVIVTEDVPDYTMVIPYQKTINLPRGGKVQDNVVPAKPAVPEAASPVVDASVRDRALTCIFAALVETNRQLLAEQQLPTDLETVLFDSRSGEGLDSLGLVNFIVICEQKLEEEFGKPVSLAARGFDEENTAAFASVRAMADFIAGRLALSR
jgi:acetyltransferase-like isoleucine patch superfamily enzyme